MYIDYKMLKMLSLHTISQVEFDMNLFLVFNISFCMTKVEAILILLLLMFFKC
jgi:hypothetical protein